MVRTSSRILRRQRSSQMLWCLRIVSSTLLERHCKASRGTGHFMHVPGEFWERCAAADKKKIYKCLVREFEGLHKFAGGVPPSAAFEVQEMGETGDGSLELSVASGEIFWIKYPTLALETSTRPAKGESWRLTVWMLV
jgi:hypothetical protein